MTAWIEEKPESKQENQKTTLEIKSEAYQTSIFFTKTENQMPKNRKSVNRNEHAIRADPKFFGTKTDLEKISKILMPP